MGPKGKSSNGRKANKSPISKEPKIDKSAPSTVSELLKKAAQQKSPASLLISNGASVSVSVKPKNPNMESPSDSPTPSTSAPSTSDKENPQAPETTLNEIVETSDTPPEDETSKQIGEELPDSKTNPLVESAPDSPITLDKEITPEQLEEPRSNIFQTPDEDSLSEPGTQDQDRENADDAVRIIEPEKQKNSEPSLLHSQPTTRSQPEFPSPLSQSFRDTLRDAQETYQNRRSFSSPSVSQLIPKFDQTAAHNDPRRLDL